MGVHGWSMSETDPPAEMALIEERRKAIRPTMSVRKAASAAHISEGRWRSLAKGVHQVSKGNAIPTRAPADTLARMAKVVGATPEQLRDVDRGDAADELEAMTSRQTQFQGAVAKEPPPPPLPDEFNRRAIQSVAEQKANNIYRALSDDPRLTTQQADELTAAINELFAQFYPRFEKALRDLYAGGVSVGQNDSRVDLLAKGAAVTALNRGSLVDVDAALSSGAPISRRQLDQILFSDAEVLDAARAASDYYRSHVIAIKPQGESDDQQEQSPTEGSTPQAPKSKKVGAGDPRVTLLAVAYEDEDEDDQSLAARDTGGISKGEQTRRDMDQQGEAPDPEGPEGGA